MKRRMSRMVEARCLRCNKRLLVSPDDIRCFLCGGEIEIRKPQTVKDPMQVAIEKVAKLVVEKAKDNPQVRKDLKKMLKPISLEMQTVHLMGDKEDTQFKENKE